MGNKPVYTRPTFRAQELRNSATNAERLLWQQLSGRKLGGFKFSRQIPIGQYICDFVCRAEKLVVELDGQHHGEMQAKDAYRTKQIEAAGFRVIRFSNTEVFNNLEGVLVMVRQALPIPNPSRLREGNKIV